MKPIVCARAIAVNDNSDTTKLIEEMYRYYDARASWHDYFMEYESNGHMEELLRPIVDDVERLIAGKRVLEIACGTGNWTEVLAKRASHIVAIDLSPRAIDIAREKLSETTNVTLRIGDGYRLDTIGGMFDVIFASDWWSHIPKAMIPHFVEGVMAVLNAGGTAVFLDMSMNEYFVKEPCHYDGDGNRISLRRAPDGSEYRVVKNFPTEEELRLVLCEYVGGLSYKEYDILKRWMISFMRPRSES
jgi:demethylmenaquinone methyltransferase/2-methoxy-6-polyprenyl-1,4-benzoquinol methylase